MRLHAVVDDVGENRVETVEHLVEVVHAIAVGVGEARVSRGIKIRPHRQRPNLGGHVVEGVDGNAHHVFGHFVTHVLPVVGVGRPVPLHEERIDGLGGGVERIAPLDEADGLVLQRGEETGVENLLRVVVAVVSAGDPLVVLEVANAVDPVLLVVFEAVAVIVEVAVFRMRMLVVAGAGVEVGAVHAGAVEGDEGLAVLDGEAGLGSGPVAEAALPGGVAVRAGVEVLPVVWDVVHVGVDAAGIETAAGDVAAEHGRLTEARRDEGLGGGCVIGSAGREGVLVAEGVIALVAVGQVVAVGVGVERVAGPPLVEPVAGEGERAVGADGGVVVARLHGAELGAVGEAVLVVLEAGVDRGAFANRPEVAACAGTLPDVEFPAVRDAVAVGVAAVGRDHDWLDDVGRAADRHLVAAFRRHIVGGNVIGAVSLRVASGRGHGVVGHLALGAFPVRIVEARGAVGDGLRHEVSRHRLDFGGDAVVDAPAPEVVLMVVGVGRGVGRRHLELAVALLVGGVPRGARIEAVVSVDVPVVAANAVVRHEVAVGVVGGVLLVLRVEAP